MSVQPGMCRLPAPTPSVLSFPWVTEPPFYLEWQWAQLIDHISAGVLRNSVVWDFQKSSKEMREGLEVERPCWAMKVALRKIGFLITPRATRVRVWLPPTSAMGKVTVQLSHNSRALLLCSQTRHRVRLDPTPLDPRGANSEKEKPAG